MGKRKRRVALLGECMIELRQGEGQVLISAYGGDTLNTATYLRRLMPAEAFEVHYITAVGDDPLSAAMVDAWDAEGIDTALVRRIPDAMPGLYWIRTDAAGEREFYYWRQASAARRVLDDGYAEKLLGLLGGGDLFYTSGITAAILAAGRRRELQDLVTELQRRGVTIAYDTNFRARLWPDMEAARDNHRRMLASVDILVTSTADENALFGDAGIGETARRVATSGIGEWVVRGEPGVTVTPTDGKVRVTPIDASRVLDTTGAGDAFDAAYLAARLAGHPTSMAVNAAHALSALVVQHGGAILDRDLTPWLTELLPA